MSEKKPWPALTDPEKIDRLMNALCVLILWLPRELGDVASLRLLENIHNGETLRDKEELQ